MNKRANLVKGALVTLLVLTVMPCWASAGDGNIIYYYSQSATRPKAYSLDDLNKITFGDSGLQMWKRAGKDEISYDDFRLFSFVDLSDSGIAPTFGSTDVNISFETFSRTIRVESSQMLSGVVVYDVQGRLVTKVLQAATSYELSLASASRGLYIVRVMCDGKNIVKKMAL